MAKAKAKTITTPPKDLISIKNAAKALNISVRTLWRHIAVKKLKAVKRGGKTFVYTDDIKHLGGDITKAMIIPTTPTTTEALYGLTNAEKTDLECQVDKLFELYYEDLSKEGYTKGNSIEKMILRRLCYCAVLSDYAFNKAANGGFIDMGANGNTRISPHMELFLRLEKSIINIADRFGITPYARAKLSDFQKAPLQTNTNDNSPFQMFADKYKDNEIL